MRLNPFRWLFRSGGKSVAPDEKRDVLVRDEDFLNGYRQWREREDYLHWTERLRHAFNLNRAGLDPEDESIDFLAFRATSGFVFHFQNEEVPAREVRFLEDLLRDRIKEAGYRLSMSDVRTREDEVQERHFLKPPLQRGSDHRAQQRYGNITLETLFRHGCPVYLRCIVTHYQDRCYLPPEDVGALFETLVA